MTASDRVEIGLLSVFLAVGMPVTAYAFGTSVQEYRHREGSPGRQLLLKLHLGIANLLIIFVYALSELVWLCTFYWYGGDVLCKVTKALHLLSFYLTSNVIVCIAVDRAYAACRISRLGHKVRAVGVVRWMLRAAWLTAIAFSLPQFYLWETFQPHPPPNHHSQCASLWNIHHRTLTLALHHLIVRNVTDSDFHRFVYLNKLQKLYTTSHLLMVFWIPFTVIILSYALILWKLQRSIDKQNAKVETYAAADSPGLEIPSHPRYGRWVRASSTADPSVDPPSRALLDPLTAAHSQHSALAQDFSKDNASFYDSQASQSAGSLSAASSRRFTIGGPVASAKAKVAKLRKGSASHALDAASFPSDGILRFRSEELATKDSRSSTLSAPPSKAHSRAVGLLGPEAALHGGSRLSVGSAGGVSQGRKNRAQSFAAVTLEKAKSATLRRSALILVAYVVCWLPYIVCSTWSLLDPDTARRVLGQKTEFLFNLVILNAILNPLIYGIRLPNVKRPRLNVKS